MAPKVSRAAAGPGVRVGLRYWRSRVESRLSGRHFYPVRAIGWVEIRPTADHFLPAEPLKNCNSHYGHLLNARAPIGPLTNQGEMFN